MSTNLGYKNFRMGRNLRRNQTLSTIVLILILATASTFFACISNAKADGVPTYAYLTVSPDPTGVNQQTTLIMWLDKINPTANGPAGGRWNNYTVEVTKPDGTKQTLGPITSDPASYAFTLYTPDQIGTYTLKFTFPGQQVTGTGGGGILPPVPINSFYAASSYTTTLTVQQQTINPSSQTSLPTEFWDRPINAQNQEWYVISGNWLGLGGTSFGNSAYNATGNFNPYTKAPNSAHIVWANSLDFGGLIGGEFGGTSTSNYYTGKSYEPKLTPPIIMNGVLYYNSPDPPKMGYYAVDLRTGETIWWHNSTGVPTMINSAILGSYGYPGISCGQIFNFPTPNEEGARPYLWYMAASVPSGTGATGLLPGQNTVQYYMYDANNGNLILTFSNSTTGGVRVQGPSGELLIYFAGTDWVAMWNSTQAIGALSAGGYQSWAWRPPTGANLDWKKGLQWNVTVPAFRGQSIAQINSGIILATTGNAFLPQNYQMEIGYDATTGKQLWVQNRTTPEGATSYGLMGPMMNGFYVEFHKDTMQWFGYSAYTGQQVWGPAEAYTNPWGVQQQGAVLAYGNLYAYAIDGIHAFSLSTGQKLWESYADNSGVNFPGFSTYPFLGASATVADGKVFAAVGNSHGDPLFRGARLYAFDSNSGNKVWSVSGFYLGTMAVADGYLIAFNGYDNRIYSFGKGQTAITVTAPDVSVTNGTSVIIKGTVTDQSTGAKGTPAIADESMSQWMEYTYMQQPKPTDAKGVQIKLTAIGPDGTTSDIGTTTSDANGMFKKMWTPPAQGEYTIVASFGGSESYWPSSSETALGVSSSTTSTTTSSQTTNQMSAETFYVFAAIMIVLIAIVAILVLRKK